MCKTVHQTMKKANIFVLEKVICGTKNGIMWEENQASET